jgi:AsmA-like C-terminal region
VMHGMSFDRPATFHALLTNPKPTGEIHCDGNFGPWQADVPSETPVSGYFTFRDADLSTLKGLSGTLASQGTFAGPLDYLAVDGITDTPNFALRTSGHPMALHTNFSAIVDGTNGNTILKNVTAQFLHSTLVASGMVVDVYPKVKGRTILLDADASRARVEDLLALAVKSDEPAMTGAAKLKVRIVIPEKDADLIDRLQLNGQFALSGVHFTSDAVQGKVDSFSRKGQGQPNDTDISDVTSELDGRFTLANGEASFSNLAFAVEGANVTLGGTYNLDSGEMDFRGKLEMDAKISQTMTGWKSVMLKPFDHFFKDKDRGAGSEIPIKIVGTRQHLSFGTDFHDKGNQNQSGASSQNSPENQKGTPNEEAKLAKR